MGLEEQYVKREGGEVFVIRSHKEIKSWKYAETDNLHNNNNFKNSIVAIKSFSLFYNRHTFLQTNQCPVQKHAAHAGDESM